MTGGAFVGHAARPAWLALSEALMVAGPGACEESRRPDAWWPEGRLVPELVEATQAECRTCPVRRECLAYALAADERDGIWGGLTPKERAALRRAS